MPFLTLEDPRAKVKGSRDPLGTVPVWSALGRALVTNITTSSNSVRGFSILLLGRYFTEELLRQNRIHETDALAVFLRMEQIGAYVRYRGHGVTTDIRGIERVQQRAEQGTVPIQADSRGAILSDQKVYGLWGLFSVPARVSGLIEDGPVGMTRIAREFVEDTYLPVLAQVKDRLLKLLRHGGQLVLRQFNPIFEALAEILADPVAPVEADFYGTHIRDGAAVRNVPQGRQARFRRLLEEHSDLNKPVNRAELEAISQVASTSDEGITTALRRILAVEALLAPAAALFDHMLARRGQTPRALGRDLRDHWGTDIPHVDRGTFESVLPEIVKHSSSDVANAMAKCHAALVTADYASTIEALLDWNRHVMAGRKAAPWVALDDNGRLDVRYSGAEQSLPTGDQLPYLWSNSYFINSLKDITRQIGAAA